MLSRFKWACEAFLINCLLMVVTDKFVYIHKPKTGGTFVTDALLRLYEGKWNLWKHSVGIGRAGYR